MKSTAALVACRGSAWDVFADPPTLRAAVSAWSPGDTIPLGRDRILRVTEVWPATEVDQEPVLVVEEREPRRAAVSRHASCAAK